MKKPLPSINQAAQILQAGGIIAYPTEAVYGLGCLPDHLESIEKLLHLKQRPIEKGLILLASDLSQLSEYLSPIAPKILAKLQASWPGPNTWILPTPDTTPTLIKGDFNTIAVRISAHPLVQQLCQLCQSPIISTSANITGEAMSYSPADVRSHFGEQLDYILPGELGDSDKPTVIIDALSDEVIRL
ncbi:L-threonylcarbamoyladenylate synthase [sulfur-oxidizing endosymbiont of Gigantopelta aegis]|uniref:L-threonylcarbamoyladenylate synthase n=1 Tax=sulfur-oxidizing endosymbiont of Gigantopelta aegis TaxID=2794934 RepID=UPI0018DE735E|nr:L-threonylcarbamoyladenylate synthase [sulfur-oxidizing endosymbiont of Gigantopelta aegis]